MLHCFFFCHGRNPTGGYETMENHCPACFARIFWTSDNQLFCFVRHFESHQALVKFITKFCPLDVVGKRIEDALFKVTWSGCRSTVVRYECSWRKSSNLVRLDRIADKATLRIVKEKAIGHFDEIYVKLQLLDDFARRMRQLFVQATCNS